MAGGLRNITWWPARWTRLLQTEVAVAWLGILNLHFCVGTEENYGDIREVIPFSCRCLKRDSSGKEMSKLSIWDSGSADDTGHRLCTRLTDLPRQVQMVSCREETSPGYENMTFWIGAKQLRCSVQANGKTCDRVCRQLSRYVRERDSAFKCCCSVQIWLFSEP